MAETLTPRRSLPLTDLSDEEAMFRDAVRDFAEERVRPLVHEMDEKASIPRALIDACFELGIMGVEIPEVHGGAGATFFMSILAVEELARVDASVAVLVDVQNTLVNNALLRWGNAEQQARYFPKLASKWVGAYALSEAGSGSDAFALACRATERGDHWELTGRKLWITNAAEAELFIILATVDPAKGYKGITAFLVERTLPRVPGGQEGGQARHPRLLHLRADPGGRARAARERAGGGRQGLQDRDRDPQRRAASASGPRWWAWPRDRSTTGCATRRSGSSSESRSPSSRACSSSSRSSRPRSRPRGS